MSNVYNFSAGPAVLPKSVLVQAQSELVNYRNSGMSVMELSHRSSLFEEIITEAERLLRDLMKIPNNYRVLFLQGGASLQFSMVPLNLAPTGKIGFLNTGTWSEKAISEAKKICGPEIQVLASSKDKNFSYVPTLSESQIPNDLAYLHVTTNNTIEGTTLASVPKTNGVPLVADMSSDILGRNYDITDFGLVYAGAQKNLGPAGVTVVIVRDDLIGKHPVLSSMLDYQILANSGSLYNTPPTYGIYIAKLVFEWAKAQGGVEQIEKNNREKAAILYDYLAQSRLFSSPVAFENRSLTTIPFITGKKPIDASFIAAAEEAGFVNLKGHRLVGGMRASLYNAFPIEGVTALVAFMAEFEQKYYEGANEIDF